jgi:excisionase family DNA binding protein
MQNPITTGEAGQILKLSADRVREIEASGQLTAVRTGNGMRLFERAEVESLASRRAAKRAAVVEAA